MLNDNGSIIWLRSEAELWTSPRTQNVRQCNGLFSLTRESCQPTDQLITFYTAPKKTISSVLSSKTERVDSSMHKAYGLTPFISKVSNLFFQKGWIVSGTCFKQLIATTTSSITLLTILWLLCDYFLHLFYWHIIYNHLLAVFQSRL